MPRQEDEKGREEKRRTRIRLLNAALIGWDFALCPFIGLAIGYFIDRWLGTAPWFLIIFLILGIAAGFVNLFRFR